MNDAQIPVAFLGGGNMGGAIIRGAQETGALGAAWVVAEPDPERRGGFEHGVATAGEAIAWLSSHEPSPGAGQVVLAVKPQMLGAVADEIRGTLSAGPSRVVISILAGIPSERVRESLGGGVRVVRAMPNLPAAIGRGMSAIALGAGAIVGDDQRARSLLEGVGRVVEIRESLMDAYTGVAGSGPAYVFYLAEAMINAGVELGLTREEALLIVRETIAGAGEMLVRTPEHPRELRSSVTSKGGTTAAATRVLDEAGVMDTIGRAIAAARHRGAELARELGAG